MRLCHRGVVIDDHFDRFDFPRVQSWLAAAYWSPGIPLAEVAHGFRHSALVAGAYDGTEQVGCMRVVSDLTRFAYFLDVYVEASARGRGLGQALVRFALEHPSLTRVYKWTLATADAHGVYERVGFHALPEPQRWMSLERKPKWLVAGGSERRAP